MFFAAVLFVYFSSHAAKTLLFFLDENASRSKSSALGAFIQGAPGEGNRVNDYRTTVLVRYPAKLNIAVSLLYLAHTAVRTLLSYELCFTIT